VLDTDIVNEFPNRPARPGRFVIEAADPLWHLG
jgi:hypothetical protein